MGKLPKRAIAAARKAAGGPVPDAAKVNLSDGASLKRALDEAAAEVRLAVIVLLAADKRSPARNSRGVLCRL